jgi:CO/xanthine dehydrogenase Mo-binding subunit
MHQPDGGKIMNRRETKPVEPQDLARGRALMVSDMKLPGMLYARLLLSPVAHGRITSLNAKKALALPGVKALVTAKDLAEPMPGLLTHEEVLHHGHVVAAVAASDPQIAARALELIEVSYEELPAVLSLEDALAQDAALVHKDKPGNIARENRTGSGDTESGLNGSYLVLDECFSIPSLATARPETTTCLAAPGQGGLTLWSNTTPSKKTAPQLAAALGLDESSVEVIRPYLQLTPATGPDVCAAELCCAMLAQKIGRPVRICLSREEETCLGPRSAGGLVRCKLGFSQDGGLACMDLEIDLMGGAFDLTGDLSKYVMTTGLMAYDLSSLKCRCRIIHGHLPPAGTLRGLEGLPAAFALESLMNQAAEKLGITPLALRRKNVRGTDLSACLGKLEEQKPASGAGIACFKSQLSQGEGNGGNSRVLCGAAALSARIDPDTGQIFTEHMHLVHTGKQSADFSGGLSLGLGAALCEELQLDAGRIQNPGLGGYRMPGSLDLPRVELTPLGSELPDDWTMAALVGPALAHAVAQAGGFLPTALPVTPERVLKGTGKLR